MTQNNINMKRTYEKPSMKVILLQHRQQLLQASLPTDPTPSPYQWYGSGWWSTPGGYSTTETPAVENSHRIVIVTMFAIANGMRY